MHFVFCETFTNSSQFSPFFSKVFSIFYNFCLFNLTIYILDKNCFSFTTASNFCYFVLITTFLSCVDFNLIFTISKYAVFLLQSKKSFVPMNHHQYKGLHNILVICCVVNTDDNNNIRITYIYICHRIVYVSSGTCGSRSENRCK